MSFILDPSFWQKFWEWFRDDFLGHIVTFAVLGTLVKIWIDHRLKVAQNKLQKDYEYQLKIREKAASVAELLSLAYSQSRSPEAFNRIAWELSLWLPKDIVCELSRCLCRAKGAKTIQEILIMVRKTLLGDSDTLTGENIVFIPMNAFTIPQQQQAKELYGIILNLKDALRGYYSASLARACADSKELFEDMREKGRDVRDFEKLLVNFINTNFELPQEIIVAAKECHRAFVEAMISIEQLKSHLIQIEQIEQQIANPIQSLRAMLDEGFAGGMLR